MPIYLGDQLVSINQVPYIPPASQETIPEPGNDVELTSTQYNDLQDAVEFRTGIPLSDNTVSTLIDQLNQDYNIKMDLNLDLNYYTEWTRPNGYPNLDSLNLSFSGTDDFIYMTYRTGHMDDFLAFQMELVNANNPATLQFGTVNNGVFTANQNETYSINNKTNYYYFFNNKSEGYIVVKITGKFKYFRLINAGSSNGTPTGGTFTQQQQHMVERIAYVPNVTNFYASGQFWGTYDLEREKIGNGNGANCTSLQDIYYRCYNLQSLDISNFYTPNVTTFYEAFCSCYKLRTLDLSHWTITTNANKNVIFTSMFNSCFSLKELNVSNWNTTRATAMGSMFYSCSSLTSINGLENWNTSNVANMTQMFNGCRSLVSIDGISNWDVSKIEATNSLFSNCSRLTHINIKNWNVAKVNRTDSMFNGCSSLKQIDFPTISTTNLTQINSMFNGCYVLSAVNLNWLKMDSGTCQLIGYLFNECRSLTEINVPSNWNLSGITNNSNSHLSIFYNCYALRKITGIANWDFRSSTDQPANGMFYNCYSLKTLDISGWKLNSTSYADFFRYCRSLESVNISGFDCTNCTSLASMFQQCYNLKNIVFPSTWNTSKVTTTANMFTDCWHLTSIPINFQSWDWSKVTTIASMFASCWSLKTINLNNLNLPECTTFATLFSACYALEEVQWDNWSIPKVTSTSPGKILSDCWNLRKIVGFPPIKLAFSLVNTFSLPIEQIVQLFENLETTTTTRTINLMTANINRLSAAQKQIATAKGWTLAN